jgi:outer membrane protein assembly factor BamB
MPPCRSSAGSGHMMNWSNTILSRGIPALAAFVAAGMLVFVWQAGGTAVPLRVPVAGGAGPGAESAISPLEEAKLTTSDGVAAEIPGAWPGFRGVGRDGISQDETSLAESWDAGGPRELWAVDVGEGYAGAAVLGGRVYLMDYDREAQTDALRCLSLADGAEIWRFSYPLAVKRNHGMSRTVPAVTEKHVVSLGPKGHVACLDAATGEFKWGIDLVREYGTKVPPWYAGQCPLIEDGRVILAPAGESLMIAVDCESGEVLWKTPNPRGWKMTHVSIVPLEFGGMRQYVYCGHRGIAGIAADDGRLLWETSEWKISIATVATPVPLPDGRLFLSGGYKAGSMMLQLRDDGGQQSAEPIYRLEAETFGATQQTPIHLDGFIYGVRPNGELVCLDPDGAVRWTSGSEHRFGLGPFLVADGKIFVMDDHGELTMAVAAPDEFRALGTAGVLDGHDSWGPMAIAAGRLIARDLTRMVCLDLRKK